MYIFTSRNIWLNSLLHAIDNTAVAIELVCVKQETELDNLRVKQLWKKKKLNDQTEAPESLIPSY